MSDIIEHPAHYAGITIEPIDVIEHLPFPLGCALKYLYRAGRKEGAPKDVDLQKARWYLRRASGMRRLLDFDLSEQVDIEQFSAMAYLLFQWSPPARELLGIYDFGLAEITPTTIERAIKSIDDYLASISDNEEGRHDGED